MQKLNNKGFFQNLKYDFPAGIVVTLVAIPLCLGISLASGAPLFSGLVAGIIGGVIVALISGSALGVSGPAAGLAVIVFAAIEELGSFESFLLAVIVAGIVQIILGLLKAGIIAYFFPSSVIKGMLSGIGIVIFLKQIPHAFGYDADPEGDLGFFQKDGHNTLSELTGIWDYFSPGPVIISILSLFVLITWEQAFVKKYTFFKLIQGPLVVVSLGIGLNLLFRNWPNFNLLVTQVVDIPVANSFGEFLGQFASPDFTQLGNPRIYILGVTIAVVASLETLLCLEATDKLDPYKRVAPPNKELVAQGIGNVIAGFIGGLPLTQVIVRSSTNIQSGGRTKASSFFHGVLMLICVVLLPGVINLIPLASLAAILLVVGYKLASFNVIKQVYNMGRAEFIPFVVTILGIVFTDLLTGISIGLVLAIFHILWNNYKAAYFFDVDAYVPGEPIKIQLSESVTFLNKAGISKALTELPDGSNVIIDASKTVSIHPDVIEIISNFELTAENRDITVNWTGLVQEKNKNAQNNLFETIKKHNTIIETKEI
ncbi:SulP family inorganic anion transporter [Cyclobacteriaceae bacterium]|nr:SulP family inorganic anion transporter [Cyclobacteriaceae bacterium]